MKLGVGRGLVKLMPHLRLICTLAAMLMLVVAAVQVPLASAQYRQLQLPVDSALLRHVLNPDAAVVLLCAGWLLLCVEFCQPGRFLPGGAGVLAISLGGYSLGELMQGGFNCKVQAAGVIGILATVLLTAALLWVAWLARRSKFRLDGKPIDRPKVYSGGYTSGHSAGYSSTAKPAE